MSLGLLIVVLIGGAIANRIANRRKAHDLRTSPKGSLWVKEIKHQDLQKTVNLFTDNGWTVHRQLDPTKSIWGHTMVQVTFVKVT